MERHGRICAFHRQRGSSSIRVSAIRKPSRAPRHLLQSDERVWPAPVQQDPLDTLGLAHQLPPELLVVLRKFSKKDAVTKTKALEELQAGWIDKAKKEEEGSYTSEILVLMLPVWVRPISMSFILRFIKCTSMY